MRVSLFILAPALIIAGACATNQAARPSSPNASPASTLGRFVWHDLSTDDLPAAQRFYRELLGWEFRNSTRLGRPYVVATHKGRLVGGLVPVTPVADQEVSQWVAYAEVADVESAVAAIEKAGGRTLVPPTDVPSAGRAAVMIDPQGAPLGVARLSIAVPDPAAPEEGTFFWMEYLARDRTAAVAFYTSTLGYEQDVADRSGAYEYVVLRRGRPRGGILQAPRPEMRPAWLPSILVADPAALAARAATLGGSVLLEPHADVRNGSVAVVADPSGAIVALQKFPF